MTLKSRAKLKGATAFNQDPGYFVRKTEGSLGSWIIDYSLK